MRVLYCKSTEKRKPEFQIYTFIVEENGSRYAVKESVYDCGKQHIRRIADNYGTLRQVYGECIVDYHMKDGRIYFPYVEGGTFGGYLRNLIITHESEEKIRLALQEWRTFLQGNESNVTVFEESVQSKEIFGDAASLVGDKALRITNFDCIADNIILSENGRKVIDYEWVYDFPIPEELTYYRVLKMFFLDNPNLVNFAKLLSLAGINENKSSIYEKLLQRFDTYISLDRERNVNYAELGKIYKVNKILSNDAENDTKYQFPFEDIGTQSKVILYGAGDVGSDYYRFVKKMKCCELTAWIDKKYEQYQRLGLPVQGIEKIAESEYDYIIIAIYNDETAHVICDSLISLGIAKEKILWKKPQYI